ncbi:hypothetical protein TEA_027576 [Camellia sinensis var. sinensis]|uniref:Kinesin motor domain-containing protein n=1 Tax=Camellia sinensis var. sinensis TaxID=542762 RepID=A0A4S4EMH6_CAMSN|nr:hypothetical protein TEA_027576 [Camellia sinensis var. sinensis]
MEASSEDCCVKVAVHIRPLIGDERFQACKECVTVVPGKPQVQIGTHSRKLSHLIMSMGEVVFHHLPYLKNALLHWLMVYSKDTMAPFWHMDRQDLGKHTLWVLVSSGCKTGLVPQVMNALFSRIETLKHQIEFQLHVSFIEILNEEVRDLLDSTSISKSDTGNGHAGKATVPGRPPIQIRETANGVITLAGLTEVDVNTLEDMAACLEQGSLSRATGSTNMNNQSSRSHAIFTITLEQIRKLHPSIGGEASLDEDMGEEYLCIYINKGLLALGNVISALGDEKKRKEGVHVPYRDSKLTRLLQDSLGGNSKTVMIACISPADINVEETLNTLKYANRARNIQNKPVVNRDLMSNEMQKMRQQLEYLQAELNARARGASSDDVQVLMKRIAWLEDINEELSRELHEYHSRRAVVEPSETDAEDGSCFVKRDGLKRGLQSMDASGYPMGEAMTGENYMEIDEAVAKEWEHALLRTTMGKELNELNKRLEQKESEMKHFGGSDTEALSLHFEKRILKLEEEKKTVQQERNRLLAEIENLVAASDGQRQKMHKAYAQKLKSLETQILDLKKNQDCQLQLLKQKQRSDEAAKRLQDEIKTIKVQKVQLQHKIKQEAEQFRQWKASHEKELLQSNGKNLQRWLDHELEVMVNVHAVRFEYEKQSQLRAALAEELALLKQVDQLYLDGHGSPRRKNGCSRMERIASIENMLSTSSDALVAMASQLSEAEQRQRGFTGHRRWNKLRSMGDAKNLLQYMFNAATDARSQLREKEVEIKDVKDELNLLVTLLQQSEAQRKEIVKEQTFKEQAVAIALATSASGESSSSCKYFVGDTSGPSSPVSMPATKQLKYTAGVENGWVSDSAAFLDQNQKAKPGNCGGGRGVIISGCCSSNGSGRNLGNSQSGSNIVLCNPVRMELCTAFRLRYEVEMVVEEKAIEGFGYFIVSVHAVTKMLILLFIRDYLASHNEVKEIFY